MVYAITIHGNVKLRWQSIKELKGKLIVEGWPGGVPSRPGPVDKTDKTWQPVLYYEYQTDKEQEETFVFFVDEGSGSKFDFTINSSH